MQKPETEYANRRLPVALSREAINLGIILRVINPFVFDSDEYTFLKYAYTSTLSSNLG